MGIDSGSQQLVAGLECVAAANQGEIILEAGALIDVYRLALREAEIELAARGGVKDWHGLGSYIGDAEFRRPILSETLRQPRALAPVPSQADFVDGCGIDDVGVRNNDLAIVDRYWRANVVEIAIGELHLPS